jgi:hypothetical protein
MKGKLRLCVILAAVTIASPAVAGYDTASAHRWARLHSAIYHMENRIASLEANPNYANDDVKGHAIDHLRRELTRVRAALGPSQPYRPTRCCYSFKPIHIR